MATYSVQLISLKCILAQENDGDEIYVWFNGKTVWTWETHKIKMFHTPREADQVSEINFVEGQMRAQDGTKPLPEFKPADYLFTGLTEPSYFQLFEDDLISDDYLGMTPINPEDTAHGNISIVFAREGAQYLLTYKAIAG